MAFSSVAAITQNFDECDKQYTNATNKSVKSIVQQQQQVSFKLDEARHKVIATIDAKEHEKGKYFNIKYVGKKLLNKRNNQ